MKFQHYLGIVCLLLCLEIAFSQWREAQKLPERKYAIPPEMSQRLQTTAATYAGRLNLKQITQWKVRADNPFDVIVAGENPDEDVLLACTFERETEDLMRLICLKTPKIPTNAYKPNDVRAMGAYWMKQLGMGKEDDWVWQKDEMGWKGSTQSVWRSSSSVISLTYTPKTTTLQILCVRPEDLPSLKARRLSGGDSW